MCCCFTWLSGLSQEQVDLLKKIEDLDGWEKVEQKNGNKATEDSPQTIPKFTLANEVFDEDEKIEIMESLNIFAGRWMKNHKH